MLQDRDGVQTELVDSSIGRSIPYGIGTARRHINIADPYSGYYGVFGTSRSSPSVSFIRLPPFIKPVPCWIEFDQLIYLSKKEAFSIPPLPLRNALLQCFGQFVYPYMPLIDLHDLLEAVDRNDGSHSISLLTFQAIMFSGLATVKMELLTAAGYTTRRDARRKFFQKTRVCLPVLKITNGKSLIMLQVLYDFDYEVDRISLIQSLLLMTYWYETPDDQKDSHHWLGIAVSLSHTIGLHRNPEESNMPPKRQRLWRRIWWSMYMRDQLIALGTRRPAIIIDEFDVPMLTVEDFQIGVVPAYSSGIPVSCAFLQDVTKQQKLAVMCIEKAKLCICLSRVLSTQYSVPHNDVGARSEEGSTKTTMMLMPRKDAETCEVQKCGDEIHKWKENNALEAKYVSSAQEVMEPGDECVILNRSLLHMVYFATLSALHRPQVLPSTGRPPPQVTAELPSKIAAELQETSRFNLRYATDEITQIMKTLSQLDLVKVLPTVGITVLLPAIITNLLDINAPDEATRCASLHGFCHCLQAMSKLREIYAAADYSTAFIGAAIRKAAIVLPREAAEVMNTNTAASLSTLGPHWYHFDLGQQQQQQREQQQEQQHSRRCLTPPPNQVHEDSTPRQTDDDLECGLNSFPVSNFLDSDGHGECETHNNTEDTVMLDMLDTADFEPDFDALLDLDAAGEAFGVDHTSYLM